MAVSLQLWTLTFPPELERAFGRHYYRCFRTHIRVALVIGFALLALHGLFIDLQLLPPERLAVVWTFRYGVGCPLLALCFAATCIWDRFFERWNQPLLAVTYLAVGLAVVSMVLARPIDQVKGSSLKTGLLQAFMYVYVVSKLRFHWAAAVCLLLQALYLLGGLWVARVPGAILAGHFGIAAGFHVIGMCAGYLIEYHTRQQFYSEHLPKQEKQATESANSELAREVEQRYRAEQELLRHRERLEEAVAERTAELHQSNERLREEMRQRERAEEQLLRAQRLESVARLADSTAFLPSRNLPSGQVAHSLARALSAAV
jgi:hypothetical protein